jgi:hypothetical protein
MHENPKGVQEENFRLQGCPAKHGNRKVPDAQLSLRAGLLGRALRGLGELG